MANKKPKENPWFSCDNIPRTSNLATSPWAMALRVISGLKDVGATETRCPECSWDVLGMFLGCLPNVCQMFAKCLRLSWCLLGQLSMIQQELPALACEVARLYRCVLFEVRDPDGLNHVKPRGAKSFFEMNGERDRRRSFWKRSTLLSLHLRVLNSPKRLSPSKNHGAA